MVWSVPDAEVSTDACLKGGGGWSGEEYFSVEFPEFIIKENHHINVLELWTVLLALRIWNTRFAGRRIQIMCDNEVSVGLINTGKGRDPMLLKLIREIHFICCVHNFQIRAVHIPGVENRLADKLSRSCLNNIKLGPDDIPGHWIERKIDVSDFALNESW